MENESRTRRMRIGLSLAPDVADILCERGRDIDDPTDKRPTRTEIIEEAVRLWAKPRELRAQTESIGETNRQHTQEVIARNSAARTSHAGEGDWSESDPDESKNSMSPKASAQRKEKRETKAQRSAQATATVAAALPPRALRPQGTCKVCGGFCKPSAHKKQ